MKISIDNSIYHVKQGKEDERFPTKEQATEQDVAIMVEALRIAQKKRPKIMNYAKLYKVSFVQLRTKEGHLDGQKTVIPNIILCDPSGGREEIIEMPYNGVAEADCLFLPLSSANAIASWMVKCLDQHVRCQVSIAENRLGTWKDIAEEADIWPYTVMGFPNYTFGELPLGRYETDFRNKANLELARLEIQPYGGQLRVRLLDGPPMKHGTEMLGRDHWVVLSPPPEKLIEELLYEELQFV